SKLGLPLPHVGFLGGVGEVDLQAAAPAVAMLARGHVPLQALTGPPFQQGPVGIDELLGMAGMDQGRVTPGGKYARHEVAACVGCGRHRYTGFYLELSRHVDDQVPKERWPRWWYAVLSQPGEDFSESSAEAPELGHGDLGADRRVGLLATVHDFGCSLH